jgi:glycine betaine/proline transport system permease protein
MYKLNELFAEFTIPANEWIQTTMLWAVVNLRPVFLAIRWPVSTSLELLDRSLRDVPALITVVVIGLLAWRASGIRLAIWSVVGFLLIGFLGLWDMAMTTVAMVLTSVIFCVVIGVPIGILVSRSDRLERLVRPVLDAMQTTPTFVYLVPIVMLFGIGNVPAVIATIIVALPPTIRLTSLGLREVDQDIVEAGHAFGCTNMQLLGEIQVPLALPTIVTGVNQSLMLSLSMVVIAALIGAGGLGLAVYSGINRLDVGVAATAGLSIVLIAIIMDRIGQAFVNRYSNN